MEKNIYRNCCLTCSRREYFYLFFPGPSYGIIFSEKSEKISSH